MRRVWGCSRRLPLSPRTRCRPPPPRRRRPRQSSCRPTAEWFPWTAAAAIGSIPQACARPSKSRRRRAPPPGRRAKPATATTSTARRSGSSSKPSTPATGAGSCRWADRASTGSSSSIAAPTANGSRRRPAIPRPFRNGRCLAASPLSSSRRCARRPCATGSASSTRESTSPTLWPCMTSPRCLPRANASSCCSVPISAWRR
jgi:hypothetical protein